MSENSSQRPVVRVSLRVLGESVTVETPRPNGQVRLDQVLPLLRDLEDKVVDVAVRQSEAAGAPISCCRGCAACCKAQPVPVTPPEAYALWRLVESMAEPRRSEIRWRFADRVEQLRAAGLAAAFLGRAPDLTKDAARAIAERYFLLGIVCPFLENDACSIYADRPFVCRQYLVTSPAALCQDPFHNPVEPLPVPIAAAGATLRIAEQMLGSPQFTVPLVLALEVAAAGRQDLERTFDAAPLFQDWVRAVVD